MLAVIALLVASCAPAPMARSTEGGAVVAKPGPARILQLGLIQGSEPRQGILFLNSTGPAELLHSFHAGLTVYDSESRLIPQVAQRVPSLENGDWKVFADGRMELTWRLRPDVRWHDGTALTAEDYAFGVRVMKDDALPAVRAPQTRLISQLDATDPHTLVVSFRGTHILANVAGPADFAAVPRHILQEAYEQGDKTAFLNNPYWTREFVGLGPYRLVDWQPGTLTEGAAFDGYFLGPPRIGRIIFRYYGSETSLLAAQLSGDVDMAPMGTFRWEHMLTLRKQWETDGTGVVLPIMDGTRYLTFQFRETAAPWARDLRVRQAIAHMIDKQSLADDFRYGLTRPADTHILPEDPAYQLLEQRGFPRYRFDSARAQQLMADAGWNRGGDGVYRSLAGEPFAIEVRFTGKSDSILEGEILVGMLNDAGARATAFSILDAAPSSVKREQRNLFTGLYAGNFGIAPDPMAKMTSSEIGTQARNWGEGNNYGGYSNPALDELAARFNVTLQEQSRQALLAEMLQLEARDVPNIHLYYDLSTNVASWRKGLRGPGLVPPWQPVSTWNVHAWEID